MENIEFKGTPGKWYIKTAEKEEHKRLSIKTDDILVVGVSDDEYEFISVAICGNSANPVVQANALLISKAPELFEMLNELVPVLKTIEGHNETVKEIEKLLKESTELK